MRQPYFIFLAVLTLTASAQEPGPVKFGKVSAADLTKEKYNIDTSAAAVIISDVGSTQIKGNQKEWFSLEFKRHQRIHILKKSGYDYATVEIPLYAEGENEEKLDDLKAVTYNYENGKVVQSKLDVKTALFKDRIDKNRVIRKFTFPNVKEGSVIEYEYKLTSDYLFNLQPWYFQREIPALWSEYTVAIPAFLKYMLISQGSMPFHIRDRKDKTGNFGVEVKREGGYGTSLGTERITISCGISIFRWAMKEVPPLNEEAYTTTLKNYMAKLEFQLAAYLEPLTPTTIMGTWPDLTQRLIKRDEFGMQLEKAIDWLPKLLPAILQNATTETEKAKKIFAYVRDNFTCTDHVQLYIDKSLKSVFDSKSGGVAEINLLLTAMLRYAGIHADPVILSRKRFGFVYDNYPVIGRFNYVISQARVDGKDMMMDASHSYLGFGKLPYDCYNGSVRVVDEKGTKLNLSSDMLTEKENIRVLLQGNEKGEWKGKVTKLHGYYESVEMREKLKSGDRDALKKEITALYENEVKIENPEIHSRELLDEPVEVTYDIAYNTDPAGIIYIHPVVSGRYKTNPFKSADRRYPVEMPYKLDESYTISLTIPDGYTADEIPASLNMKLNEQGDAAFEYVATRASDKEIRITCRLETKKALFATEEYEALREFFNRVVAKQNEQVVLKKR